MEHRIIVATGNEGKMREVRLILADLGIEIISMKEAGASCEIEETGSSFAENAEIKAKAVWEQTGHIVLADDSGLVVDYLGGEPGIYSARYMGEDTSYEIKNQAIIDRVAEAKEEERTARFVSAIAAVLPDGTILHTEGTVEGEIAYQPAGTEGFGYDPIFYLPEYGMTSAQIPIEKKNEISHRGKALEAMKQKLKGLYREENR
ncbi:MAG: XTP/dITP diphosphatase [Hungatella sp.]|nr:XTP/dITP diphosphatase [Hungatella sp.]